MPAPTQPSAIPAIPDAPTRSSGSPTFSPDADAWAAAWGPATTAVQAHSDYMEAAVVYIDAQITGATTTISAAQTTAVAAVTSAQAAAVAAVEAAEAAGVAAVNAVVAAAGFGGTSTTSNAVGTGSKTWTTQTGLAFRPGSFVEIADTAAPTTNYLIGQVTAYDIATGILTATITHTGGSGTKTSWIVVMTGKPGTNGSDATVNLANVETAVGGPVALLTPTIVTESGTSRTLSSTDNGKIIRCTSSSPVTITVPNSLAVGFNCAIEQAGSGAVTVTAGSGATARNVDGDSQLAGQYAIAGIIVDTNSGGSSAVYTLFGRTT